MPRASGDSPGKRVIPADLFACLALLVSVVGLFYFSLAELVGSDNPTRHAGLGDTYAYLGPASFYLDVSLREGEVPLWNPHTYAGMPFAAHPLSMVFYPPNLVRSVLARAETPRDTLVSLHLMSLFHLLVLALGLYALARCERLRPATSFAVAVAVPFSRNWLQLTVYFNYAVSACAWTPLILVCLHEALGAGSPRRRAGWIAVGSLLYGLQILAGHPQLAIYATVVYVAYVLLKVAVRAREQRRGPASAASGVLGWTGLLAAFGAAGVAVAAIAIAPSIELMALSARAAENFETYTDVSPMVNASTWKMARTMIENAQPGFGAKFLALIPLIERMLSLSVGALIAVCAAALAPSRAGPMIYGLLLYGLCDLILGSPMPLAFLFERLVPVETSTPLYCIVLIAIPMGMLAGFGVDAVVDRARAGSLRWGHAVYLLLAGAFTMALVQDPPTRDAGVATAWLLLPLAVLGLLLLSRAIPRALPGLVVAVLLLEVALCGRAYVEELFGHPVYPYPGSAEELDATPPEFGSARVIASAPNQHLWSRVSAINGYEPLSLTWVIPQLSNAGREHMYTRSVVMSGNRQAAALLKRRFWLVPAYVHGEPPEKSRLFPPAAAVFLAERHAGALPELTLEQLPTSTLAAVGEEIELWSARGRRKQPRVQLEITPPRRHSVLFVTYRIAKPGALDVTITGEGPRDEFSFRRLELPASPRGGGRIKIPLPDFAKTSVSLSIDAHRGLKGARLQRVTMASDAADEIERVDLVEFAPDRVVLNLRNLPGPRMLVFTDAHYPGWTATLDGSPVPIALANGAFKAVEVPAGDHRLRFEFESRSVRAGLTVSLATLVAVLLLLVWASLRASDSVPRR